MPPLTVGFYGIMVYPVANSIEHVFVRSSPPQILWPVIFLVIIPVTCLRPWRRFSHKRFQHNTVNIEPFPLMIFPKTNDEMPSFLLFWSQCKLRHFATMPVLVYDYATIRSDSPKVAD